MRDFEQKIRHGVELLEYKEKLVNALRGNDYHLIAIIDHKWEQSVWLNDKLCAGVRGLLEKELFDVTSELESM